MSDILVSFFVVGEPINDSLPTWSMSCVPRVGDFLDVDDSEPDLPTGSYIVDAVFWKLGLRGVGTVVHLMATDTNPKEPEHGE